MTQYGRSDGQDTGLTRSRPLLGATRKATNHPRSQEKVKVSGDEKAKSAGRTLEFRETRSRWERWQEDDKKDQAASKSRYAEEKAERERLGIRSPFPTVKYTHKIVDVGADGVRRVVGKESGTLEGGSISASGEGRADEAIGDRPADKPATDDHTKGREPAMGVGWERPSGAAELEVEEKIDWADEVNDFSARD